MFNFPEIIESDVSEKGKAVLKYSVKKKEKNGIKFKCRHYFYEDLTNGITFMPGKLWNYNLELYNKAYKKALEKHSEKV